MEIKMTSSVTGAVLRNKFGLSVRASRRGREGDKSVNVKTVIRIFEGLDEEEDVQVLIEVHERKQLKGD